MKKLIVGSICGLLLSACTTMQAFKPEDVSSEGVRYRYGAASGVKKGDKVNAYKRNTTGHRRGYSSEPIGTLTVSRVENDFSILQKDGEFQLDDSSALLIQ